jgi:hypothetical protein
MVRGENELTPALSAKRVLSASMTRLLPLVMIRAPLASRSVLQARVTVRPSPGAPSVSVLPAQRQRTALPELLGQLGV